MTDEQVLKVECLKVSCNVHAALADKSKFDVLEEAKKMSEWAKK